MKVIIAGSRDITNYELVKKAMERCGFVPTEIFSGTARGVDQLGERWAREHSIPVRQFPADWDRFGKSAGYKRNEEMAKRGDALVALWDGKSKGTHYMIQIAKAHKLKIKVYKQK